MEYGHGLRRPVPQREMSGMQVGGRRRPEQGRWLPALQDATQGRRRTGRAQLSAWGKAACTLSPSFRLRRLLEVFPDLIVKGPQFRLQLDNHLRGLAVVLFLLRSQSVDFFLDLGRVRDI